MTTVALRQGWGVGQHSPPPWHKLVLSNWGHSSLVECFSTRQEAQGSIPCSVQIKPHPVSSGLLLSLLPVHLLIFPPAPTRLLFPKYVHLFSPEEQFFLSLLRTLALHQTLIFLRWYHCSHVSNKWVRVLLYKDLAKESRGIQIITLRVMAK